MKYLHQSKATDYFIHEFMHEALENSQSHSYLWADFLTESHFLVC